jgi:hypothetical protein
MGKRRGLARGGRGLCEQGLLLCAAATLAVQGLEAVALVDGARKLGLGGSKLGAGAGLGLL